MKSEKIMIDPSKCDNSGQTSGASDYIACGVLDNEPEVQEFSRKIRAKAVGILQRSQIIENEQRRKKKEIASREQVELRDFEAEKRRCEEIISKELDEINQENRETLKRREELNRDQQEFLERRERGLQERKLKERDFEAKIRKEWESMNASIDANRNLQLQNAMARRKRQEIAATKLEELRRSEEESLSNQAARASTELELGRSMLESLKDADEAVVGSLRNLREQAKYRSELDHCRNLKKVANDERKNRDLEVDRLYKEACEREEVKRRENDVMKRNIGLKIGKCLRDQIEANDGEKRKLRNAEMKADIILIENQNKKDECIENAKKQMLSEFQAWKTCLKLPPGSEKLTNKATHQIQVPKPISCTQHWTTVSSGLVAD
ncbi:unnamed protein product [Hymenolepis diminuta]|uniref:Trichohyalin-plectin-homology domain-containing protein n=1 Tax=Hymenolepis diminuta TaxID=6216 RepID=A0A3P6YHS3_HYMDI|nr:unnamed protein product [Hymenolepis diminuta]